MQFKSGFVFGKFMPFHKGHEAMILFTASLCEKLYVIVCVSNKEQMPADLRKNWIANSFADNLNIEVILFNYDEEKLSNSSESSREISKTWAIEFKKLLPDVELLVSSEPYGDFVAEYMDIEHRFFDRARNKYPISASKIRSNPYENWEFLPDAVKPFYQLKVVILGTESTGKTTLSAYLSNYINAPLVKEMGRELIPNSEQFEMDDLKRVAAAHQFETELALKRLKPLIIMDTDIHITQSYAIYKFGQYLDLPEQWYETQKASLYLYLSKDSPYEQDGSRMTEDDRNKLDGFHRKTLEKFGIQYTTLSTDFESRKQDAIRLIYKLLGVESL